MNEKKESIKDKVLIEFGNLPYTEFELKLIELTEKLTREQLSLEEKGCMKETKCRNCGQLKATETWRVCSVCGDILQDYLIDTYTERQKITSLIENFQNPYPKDIFTWDNKEKITDERGKYNKIFHMIVENMREDLLKEIRGE